VASKSTMPNLEPAPRFPRIAPRLSIADGLHAHPNDSRWQLAQRVAASESIGRSKLLADFLLYIVDRYICNLTDEITEHQIGVVVFGRAEGYDSNEDNIVRSYARNLRKRLDEYFSGEGSNEILRIEIPRGGYLPVFYSKEDVPVYEPQSGIQIPATSIDEPVHAAGAAITDGTVDSLLSQHDSIDTDYTHNQEPERGNSDSYQLAQTAESVQRAKELERIAVFRKRALYVLGLCIVAIMGVVLGRVTANKGSNEWLHPAAPAAKVYHMFWSQLFGEKQDTFIVPADGGLVMLQSFVKQHVSLEDYANGSYRKESTIAQGIVGLTRDTNPDDAQRLMEKVEVLGKRRYTSIADLELTTRLARLPEVVPERFVIRYARDLRIDDLRTDNAILLGSIEANPWVDLFQRQLNFQFQHGAEFGGSGILINRHPLVGEQASYASVPNDPLFRTYGLIAYVPNLDGTGHVLMIEGVNMAGTEAAGAFLLSPESMQPVLQRAMRHNGTIRPFEVLLETRSVAASASRTTILSIRIEPI
jgi:hypothetical protein